MIKGDIQCGQDKTPLHIICLEACLLLYRIRQEATNSPDYQEASSWDSEQPGNISWHLGLSFSTCQLKWILSLNLVLIVLKLMTQSKLPKIYSLNGRVMYYTLNLYNPKHVQGIS